MEKLAFSIETNHSNELSRSYTREATGRLVGSSVVAISSQWIGRVRELKVSEWAVVKTWDVLANLSDTTANYPLRLEQAKNTLKNIDVTIQSTKLSLEKNIQDTKFAKEKAQSTYENIQADANERLEKAQNDVKRNDTSSALSDAAMILSQLETSLEKSELDLKNLQTNNTQTLRNLDPSFGVFANDAKKLFSKVLYEGDKTFGFTSVYKNENIDMRRYFWGKDDTIRANLEDSYRMLASSVSTLDSEIVGETNESNVLVKSKAISSRYEALRTYLLVVQKYLENSIISPYLTQTSLDLYVAQYNGYKTELSTLDGALVTFTNTTRSFLESYKNNESSAQLWVEILKKQIAVQKNSLTWNDFDTNISLDRTKIATDNDRIQARITLENATKNYTHAIEEYAITMKKLQLSRSDALLALEQAEKEVKKLTITAPISGTISKVSGSVWQDVSLGTPLFELVNEHPEVLVNFPALYIPLLSIGDTESIQYNGKNYTGTIVGMSQVASDSLLYTIRIALESTNEYLWEVATIKFLLEGEYPLLPTNVVKVISEQEGEIAVFKNGNIEKQYVKLWRILGDHVEILSPLDENGEIIMNDISNFDPKKFFPQKRAS